MNVNLVRFTYLAFHSVYCLHYHLGVASVVTWNGIKGLVEVELHVTHFEVVTFDLQISGECATIKSVGGEPLTRPEGLEFVIVATNLDRLMPFVVTLCYCENCRALLISTI